MRPSLSRLVVAESGSAGVDRDDDDLATWASEQGWQVERVRAKHLERNQVVLDRETLVVGSIQSVRAALRVLGSSLPDPDDYPDVLRPHFHRRTWSSTVGALRTRIDDGAGPVFAKSKQLKRFTGRVFEHPDDLRFISGLSTRTPIWCSEVVAWRTEWRLFVVDGEVVGQRHYSGEPWTAPDPAVVADCLQLLAATPDVPAGYAIDLGVLSGGQTAVVERNDGFSVASYGLETSLYARVLIARWTQLLDNAHPDSGT